MTSYHKMKAFLCDLLSSPLTLYCYTLLMNEDIYLCLNASNKHPFQMISLINGFKYLRKKGL